MKFYTEQHQYYCGVDLHARSMHVCILNQAGEFLVHRGIPATPDNTRIIRPMRQSTDRLSDRRSTLDTSLVQTRSDPLPVFHRPLRGSGQPRRARTVEKPTMESVLASQAPD